MAKNSRLDVDPQIAPVLWSNNLDPVQQAAWHLEVWDDVMYLHSQASRAYFTTHNLELYQAYKQARDTLLAYCRIGEDGHD